MRRLHRSCCVYGPLVLLILTSSCGGGGGTEPAKPAVATKLVLVMQPSASAGTFVPLATQPVIQAVDASGKAVPTNVMVKADVLVGSGAVMAGDSAATDAGGRAAFSGLTLQAVRGQVGLVTLRFSAPGLTPVTADVELRCVVPTLVLGQSITGDVTGGDCTRGSPDFANFFAIVTSQPVTAVRLTTNAPVVGIAVKGPNDAYQYTGWAVVFADNGLTIKALLAAGRSGIVVSSPLSNLSFSYTLTTAATTEDLTCDQLDAVATSPITTAQQLVTGDCVVDGFLEDHLLVGLPANASVSATMTTSAFDPRLRLVAINASAVVAEVTGKGSANLAFTNGNSSTNYRLVLSSAATGSTGPYSLSLQIAYPPSVRSADVVSSFSQAPHVSRN